MDTKRTARTTALSVAAGGTAIGVVGLVLLAVPAGAGEAPPKLPPIEAQELVESALDSEVPALAGSVEVDNSLGLPIPGLPQASDGDSIQVYSDGTGKGRLSLGGNGSETTIVDDGETVWTWDSATRTVTKSPHGGLTGGDNTGKTGDRPMDAKLADPAEAAKELVTVMRADSEVTVDGTAMVADRPVYQLVLTPKPTERTLIREVRVSIDEQLRLPVRLDVLANGQSEPALRIGFTELDPGAQDADLFRFTPPADATVTEQKQDRPADRDPSPEAAEEFTPETVGEGWDTVFVASVPSQALPGAEDGDGAPSAPDASGQDVTQLLDQFGERVDGEFGTGWLVKASVGTALITEDGRVAVGAVPEQVVLEAIEDIE